MNAVIRLLMANRNYIPDFIFMVGEVLMYVQTPCRSVTGLKVKASFHLMILNSPLCFQSIFAFYRRVLTGWIKTDFYDFIAIWFYPDLFQGNIAVTRLRCILSPENNPRSFLLITQNQLKTRYVIFHVSVNGGFKADIKGYINEMAGYAFRNTLRLCEA